MLTSLLPTLGRRTVLTQKYRARVLYFLACAIPAGMAHAADHYCLNDWACVTKQEQDKQVDYWIYNNKPFVVTVTLEVDTFNLKTVDSENNTFVIHQVLQGHEKVKVLGLTPKNKAKSIWYDESFYWTPGNMLAEHQPDTDYRLPFSPDQSFPIVQGFGGQYSHSGASKYAVDFAMPVGTPVHAARGGVVMEAVAHHNRGGPDRKYASYANYVVILHDDQTTGEYYHLKQGGAVVKVGEQVKAGQKIAYSGNTGFSSLPHLHFAIYRAQPFGKFQSLAFNFR